MPLPPSNPLPSNTEAKPRWGKPSSADTAADIAAGASVNIARTKSTTDHPVKPREMRQSQAEPLDDDDSNAAFDKQVIDHFLNTLKEFDAELAPHLRKGTVLTEGTKFSLNSIYSLSGQIQSNVFSYFQPIDFSGMFAVAFDFYFLFTEEGSGQLAMDSFGHVPAFFENNDSGKMPSAVGLPSFIRLIGYASDLKQKRGAFRRSVECSLRVEILETDLAERIRNYFDFFRSEYQYKSDPKNDENMLEAIQLIEGITKKLLLIRQNLSLNTKVENKGFKLIADMFVSCLTCIISDWSKEWDLASPGEETAVAYETDPYQKDARKYRRRRTKTSTVPYRGVPNNPSPHDRTRYQTFRS